MIVFACPWLRVNNWRSVWPAAELRRRGWDVKVVGHDGDRNPAPKGTPLRWRISDADLRRGDTMILHTSNQDVGMSGTVRHFRSLGVKVFVQFDDDWTHIRDIQEVHPDRSGIGPLYAQLVTDIVSACRAASGIVCSTPQVERAYARWAARSWAIRNWIPEWVTRIERPRSDPPVAGWFGTLHAHRRDVEWLGTEAKRIGRVGVLGDPDGFEELTGVELVDRYPVTLDMRAMYGRIARWSAGFVPAVDDPFNAAKSWIKPLEFAALDIPAVASDIAPYRELASRGLPLVLTRSPEEMARIAEAMRISRDIERPDLRPLVRERFTLEAVGGDEWESFLNEVGAS